MATALALAAALLMPLGGVAAAVGSNLTVCPGNLSTTLGSDADHAGHHVHGPDADPHSHGNSPATPGERWSASCLSGVTVAAVSAAGNPQAPHAPAAAATAIHTLAPIAAPAALSSSITASWLLRPPDPPLLATVILRN